MVDCTHIEHDESYRGFTITIARKTDAWEAIITPTTPYLMALVGTKLDRSNIVIDVRNRGEPVQEAKHYIEALLDEDTD